MDFSHGPVVGPASAGQFSEWMRIEPRSRSDDFSRGLAARIADPLWIVGRQWQLREFKAEDAGSPINVDLKYQTRPFSRLNIGTQIAALGAAPLETLVEREPVPMDWRARIRMGQQFERFLNDELGAAAPATICRFRMRFPVTLPTGDAAAALDHATFRFVELMSGRATHGEALLAAIDRSTSPPALPGGLGLAADAVDPTRRALKRLLEWDAAFASRPSAGQDTAWVPRQLEYKFELSEQMDATGVQLGAPHYSSGDLDWYAFDRSDGGIGASPAAADSMSLMPTRMSFYGMPSACWWAFEDGRTDFGRLDVARTDIAKLMLMEFALVYGNDWHIVPLRLPVGSVTSLAPLDVVDVFGVHTLVNPVAPGGPSPLDSWRMFTPTCSMPDVPGVLVIPPVVERIESDVLEEVRFIRDEGANMVFAIEARVLNGLGESMDGYEAQRDRRQRVQEVANQQDIAEMDASILELQGLLSTPGGTGSMTPETIAQRVAALQTQIASISARLAARGTASPASAAPGTDTGLPSYRLATTVPDNWIPYLPVHQGTSYRSIAFRQGQMVRNESNAAPEPIAPMSRLLVARASASDESWLNEECVPREGRRLALAWQRARWVDGTTHLWLGRSTSLGKGEGSSGLRFDIMKK